MSTQECVVARLLELCAQRQLSLNALAMSAGVAPSTVKNIVNGNSRNPGVVTLKLLCDGLGITLADFFDAPAFRALEQELR